MSKLSFRARALDASKPMPIYLAEELPDLPDYSAINRAVPQMPSGMEKEEECEHHLQRAICTGLIIPTPEVYEVNDIEFYERCYPPDYKMPKQHIHMQPLWQEQEAPEYDIDSEDERWLKQQRHPELTELKFEQMMDKLEKSSGQTVVTLNEAKLLLERHDDLVIAVYDYWLNKRLKTQHPLILSVKTENRPGQSTNNPYLAFRRRTEKMQTRKNRKNDESSYEKMLKLRRDLGRALSLLELVARRERSKRELVQLTALLAERRYSAGDYTVHASPDPVLRPQFTPVSVTSSSSYRREAYTAPHYPPRAPSTPVDQPRQREKRPYKRRKHRHHAAPHGPRDIGVYTSSEEEGSVAAEETDDSPYAFRRKPGCYYQMPTSTLCGDPVDPDDTDKERLYQHEIDPRHRFTLTSLRCSWGTLGSEGGCIGFARRRLGRGGRVLLDRLRTPLDDLWPRLPAVAGESDCNRRKQEQIDLETKAHRTPMEISKDYHTGGKYPWRHAFRQHLSKHPELWTVPVKEEDVKPTLDDVKLSPDVRDFSCKASPDVRDFNLKTSPDVPDFCKTSPDVRDFKDDLEFSGVKSEKMDIDSGDDKVLPHDNISDNSVSERRTMDGVVMENLGRTIGGRSWSVCSDTSYDSDESLHPVEQEFEKFINEVNKKWLHFRPKTPPPSPPQTPEPDSVLLPKDTEFNVTLISDEPSTALDPFTTENFTLQSLYTDINEDMIPQDDDLINDIGLTDAQVESILSETDLKALADVDLVKDDKKVDLLEELVKEVDTKDPFLSQGQSSDGRANSGPKRKKADAFGSSVVQVVDEERPVTVAREWLQPPPAPAAAPASAPASAPAAAPASKDAAPKDLMLAHATDKIVQKPAEPPQIKIDRKKQHDDVIEEIQLTHGLQVKTVQTKQSPLKKHIITTAVCSTGNEGGGDQPQILTVAVSDSLKVRLGSQVVSGSTVGGRVLGVLQNGPFTHALHLPIHNHNSDGQGGSVGLSTGRARVSAPLVQLAHKLHNKLKVHPLPQGHTRGAGQAAGAADAASAPLTQLFEIKGRPHQLINVPRHLHPNNKHKVLATFENAGVKGSVSSVPNAQRVSVSLDGRLVRACLPARLPARLPSRARQIHLNNRTLQVARPQLARTGAEATSSITLPSAVVANLLHNTHNKGQKIAISGAAGQALSANVQAIAFTTAQLKARQARLIAQPRPAPVAEIVEASSTPNAAAAPSGTEDNLPMEVT